MGEVGQPPVAATAMEAMGGGGRCSLMLCTAATASTWHDRVLVGWLSTCCCSTSQGC